MFHCSATNTKRRNILELLRRRLVQVVVGRLVRTWYTWKHTEQSCNDQIRQPCLKYRQTPTISLILIFPSLNSLVNQTWCYWTLLGNSGKLSNLLLPGEQFRQDPVCALTNNVQPLIIMHRTWDMQMKDDLTFDRIFSYKRLKNLSKIFPFSGSAKGIMYQWRLVTASSCCVGYEKIFPKRFYPKYCLK